MSRTASLVWSSMSFNGWLSGRQQRVVVDSATSNVSPVLSGVPQGLVLGPLLFLVYINCVSLVPDVSEGSKISMYADDILLSKPINHPDNYDDLQRAIDAIQECISHWHLIPQNAKYLIASRRRQPDLPPTRLFIGRDVLEQVENYHYLYEYSGDVKVILDRSYQSHM